MKNLRLPGFTPPSTPPIAARLQRPVLAACVLALALVGFTGNETHASQGLEDETHSLKLWVEHIASEATRQVPGRVEVEIGRIDPRMKLAPCARSEPFVPAGARLWGATLLGMRCREGANWQVFIPVRIRVFAPALVAARPLPAGTRPVESDFRLAEVDLTREPGGVIADTSQFAGRELGRALIEGAALRTDHLRLPQVVAQGDTVKLVYRGDGFSVSTQGRAAAAAQAGQPVRVLTESGRSLSGIAREGRIVEVQN